jgi:hypothetical protein
MEAAGSLIFFMLPPEAHQGSAADLVEPHDSRSL